MSEEDIKYNNYVVAFIDVLGQKEAFCGLNEFSVIVGGNKDLEDKLLHTHVQTAHHVKGLRDDFKSFFSQYLREGEIPENIPADRIEDFKKIRKVDLKYKSFSDCIQFFTSLNQPECHSPAMNAVYCMLNSCGAMLFSSLADKKVFRAGIDIGIGIEIEDDEVYGPALFRAYDLESKIAQYPRIVIGDELVNYLQALSQGKPQIKNQMKEDIGLCQTMAQECLKIIVKDIDGYIILDYLGDSFSSKAKKMIGKDFMDIFRAAADFVTSEHEKYCDSKNVKLAQRYYLLNQYFLKNKNRILNS